MANNTEDVELLNTSIIERVIEDHNQAMREDMASELVGGNRSRAITNVITVKAIKKLIQQEANRQKHLIESEAIQTLASVVKALGGSITVSRADLLDMGSEALTREIYRDGSVNFRIEQLKKEVSDDPTN